MAFEMSKMSLTVRRNAIPSIFRVIARKDMHEVKVKPFEEIPGPRPLPLIGNLWRYFPIIGNYSVDKIHHTYAKMYEEYGPLVKEKLHRSRTLVHVFDPDDMFTVYEKAGRLPERRSHRALAQYRSERPHIYPGPGLFPSNGEEWYRFRHLFQGILMAADDKDPMSDYLENVTEDLMAKIVSVLDSKQETDVRSILFNWALESIGVVTLNRRLGCLHGDGNKEALGLIEAANNIHYSVFQTENNPLSYTKYYKILAKSQEYVERVVQKYMEEAMEEIKQGKNADSFLAQMLRGGRIQKKEIFTMILDMFMAGIDTTANTLAFNLYNLAINEQVQDKLRAELMERLPTKTTRVSAGRFRARYLQLVMKETLRVNPVAFGNGRVIPTDLVLSGYRVPAKTLVILQHQVACMQEEYFPDPKTFNPERDGPYCNQAVYSPFGYGTRVCIGFRIARAELKLAIARIIRNFRLSYHYDPIDSKNRLINVPDKPVRLRFEAVDD